MSLNPGLLRADEVIVDDPGWESAAADDNGQVQWFGGPGWEVETDELGVVQVVNDTDIDLNPGMFQTIESQIMADAEVASLIRWTRQVQGRNRGRRGTIIDRDRYRTPVTTFDQVRTARETLDDDVVAGVADLTESLAFKRTGFYADDEDQEDIWNQWAASVNLDALMRSAWRSLFTDSMAVFAIEWGRTSLTPRGETDKGNARRKTFDVAVPTALSTIDALKVTPIGTMVFGRERLAYVATPGEADAFDMVLEAQQEALRVRNTGRLPSGAPLPILPTRWDESEMILTDDIVGRLIVGRYPCQREERMVLEEHGVDCSNLFLLASDSVFRHTMTKTGSDHFPRVRMKSVFELLDMKNQLRQKDRVFLMAGINFILVVKQGSDNVPAEPEEIAHLRKNVRTIAQMPIIVGPHTLTVEIVTPNMESVLSSDKWDVVDERLATRLLRQFGPRTRTDKSGDIAQMVGHFLESERLMLRRTLEQKVFDVMMARNDSQLTDKPLLKFSPSRIALAFDQAYAAFIADLRATREISRDTALSEFDISQSHEARMLEREKKKYDSIFGTLATPGAAPSAPFLPAPPKAMPAPGDPQPTGTAQQRRAGRQGGGNRNGGGAAPGTGQGQAPRNPRKLSDAELPFDVDEVGEMGRRELLAVAKWLEIPGRSRMSKDDLLTAIAEELGEEDERDRD